MYSSHDLTSFFLTVIPIFVCLSLAGLVLYILHAVGLYKMGKTTGLELRWLAFLPIANLYVMGKLVGNMTISGHEVPKPEIILPVSAVAVLVIGQLPVIGALLTLAVCIIYFIALYKLYKNYRPDRAAIYLIVSVVLGFMIPVFIFVMRNEIPVEQRVELQS